MSYQSMRHSEHPHEIFLVNETTIFTCKLCNELGVKWQYKCTNPGSRCKFHLHTACADVADPAFHKITPAIYGERHTFDFLVKPVNDRRCCVACGRRITGYNYHCDKKNLDLHPGCTREFPKEITVRLQLKDCSREFPKEIKVRRQLKDCSREFPKEIRVLNVRLELKKRLYGKCQHCDSSSYKGGSEYLNPWAYVSDCGTYQYFAGCVRDAGVRVYAQAQAITGPNESTHAHQVHYNKVPGGGHQVLNVAVPTIDFFNQLVSAFTVFPV